MFGEVRERPAGARLLRLALLGAAAALCGACFDFQGQLSLCRDDAGAWVCPRGDGGGGSGGTGGAGGGSGGAGGGSGGAGGGSGGGAGGGGGGGGSGGGSGGAGGGSGGAGGGGVLFLGDGGCPGLQRRGWCWESPIPSGHDLLDVVGASDSDVWVAGRFGTLLHWNGAAWEESPGVPPAWSTGELWSLALTPGGRLWAAGAGIDGLWRRDGASWSRVSAAVGVPDLVFQLAALEDGGVLAAGENGVFSSAASPLLSIAGAGLNTFCTGVAATPAAPGGFVAACEHDDAGVRTRRLLDGTGAIELSEAQSLASDYNFHFHRLWKDGAGRVLATASGTFFQDAGPYGSVHVRDGGSWGLHFVNSGGTAGTTDLYAGVAGAGGSSYVVGQYTSVAELGPSGSGLGPSRLPASMGGIARAAWRSPSGATWVVGDEGYVARGAAGTAVADWQVLRGGVAQHFFGAAAVGGRLWLVGEGTSIVAAPGLSLPSETLTEQTWRGLWVSPDGGMVVAAGQGGTVRQVGVRNLATGAASFHDVWGTGPDDVLITSASGLHHHDGVTYRDIFLSGADELWKVHGDLATGEAWAAGTNGLVVSRASRDAGWSVVPAPGGAGTLYAVAALGGGRVVVAGDNGGVWERPAGGPWQAVSLSGIPYSGSLYDVWPAPKGGYFLTGAGGAVIWRQPDGGLLPMMVDTSHALERIRVLGGRLYVVGQGAQVLSRPEP